MNRLTPLVDRGYSLYQQSLDYYESLSPRSKLLLWLWVALHVVGMVAFWWIGWENIFACESLIPLCREESSFNSFGFRVALF
jgi:hypothetical protein